MHLTTTTVWEAELHRQDLLAIVSQHQRTQREMTQTTALRLKATSPLRTAQLAARYARYLLTILATLAFGWHPN